MRKISTLLFTLSIFLVVSGCDCITGEGPVVSEYRDIGDFTGIKLNISAKVIIDQGMDGQCRIETQQNILEALETEVEGGVLHISLDQPCITRHDDIKIYVSMNEIDYIKISGSGDIVGKSMLKADHLDMKISGSGDIKLKVDADKIQSTISGSGTIELAGKARKHEININGSGDVRAVDMPVKTCKVKISGSGDCEVYALRKLYIKISGSGNTYYKGSPEIESHVSGSGVVRNF
ncbi:head GIN domain-containing protein [Bacteroidota bacterium]